MERIVARDMLGRPCYDRPQTNADRIRGMRDEELARFITNIDPDNPCPPDGSCSCTKSNRLKGWLDWLKQEASDVS